MTRGQEPEFPQRREEVEDLFEPRIVERALACRQHQVLPHGQSREDAHGFGNVRNSKAGNPRRFAPGNLGLVE